MSLDTALRLALILGGPVKTLGLAKRTLNILQKHGFRSVGNLRDALLSGETLAGISQSRRNEIWTVLQDVGLWKQGDNFQSHIMIARMAHSIGVDEAGVAAFNVAERRYQTQQIEFSAVSSVTHESVKSLLLDAYRKRRPCITFRVATMHDVPLLGTMQMNMDLTLPVDTMHDMLNDWHQSKKEPVGGSCVVVLRDQEPRMCDITYNFESRIGTMLLKPPSAEAKRLAHLTYGPNS